MNHAAHMLRMCCAYAARVALSFTNIFHLELGTNGGQATVVTFAIADCSIILPLSILQLHVWYNTSGM